MKVRRLFRVGVEVDCLFIAEEKIFEIIHQVTLNFVKVYSYEFNGNKYIVKEKQLSNQKNFVLGKTKLTALIDPAKPNKAIVKENYT